jgi:hypothetical protein
LQKGAEPTADTTPHGLSRRGWMMLVAAAAALGVGLLAVVVIGAGVPAGRGTAVSSESQRAPEPQPAPTSLNLPPRPAPIPTRTQVATVPLQPFDSIAPGECLQTYESKWANSYPVVDCSAPHIAQLLSTGVLPQPAGASFPGTAALDSQISDLCEPFLDWNWVAIWNEDVQLDLRYPNTNSKWATGTRAYSCFVSTVSRHELTGSALTDP